MQKLMKMNIIQIAKLITLLAVGETAVLMSQHNNRVIGGETIDITEAPYTVVIVNFSDDVYKIYEGIGSLIAADLVLATNINSLGTFCDDGGCSVTAGISKQYDTNGTFINVKDVITHEKYNYSNADYDIALLRLEKKFELSSKINIIPLATADLPLNAGEICTVAGWGKRVPDHDASISRVSLPIVELKTCMDLYSNTFFKVTENMICAGFKDGSKGICLGDTGVPLVCNGVQYGIALFGFCQSPWKLGVYVSIRSFRQWIDDHSKLN